MKENSEWNRGKLLETSSSYWQPCALHAAVKLDIFSLLNDNRHTAAELSAKSVLSERGLTLLLNALTAMGLVTKNGNTYLNTEAGKTYLDHSSAEYIGHIINHHHHLVDAWSQLNTAVASGRPVEKRSYGEEQERESFLMGMFNLASTIAPLVAAKINLSDRRNLLDLGGGPGTYAIHFCLANPGLRATVFDRPTTREFMERTVHSYNLDDYITFQAGDFNADHIDGKFDSAWLSHIIHSNNHDTCTQLIRKTVSCMEPGGIILIHDFFLNESKDGPLFPALFSLNMLLNNNGRSYSWQETIAILESAGVVDIKRLDFIGPNDSGILCGHIPDTSVPKE